MGVESENAKREFWTKYKELRGTFINEKKAAWTDVDVAAFSDQVRRAGYTSLTDKQVLLSLETDRCLYWDELKKFQGSGMCREFVNKKQGEWNHSDWFGFVEEVRKVGFNFLTDAEIGLVLEGEKSKYWNAKQRYVEIRPCREELTPRGRQEG